MAIMKKQVFLKSANVALRLAEVSDAHFLFELRQDSEHIKFIDPFENFDMHVAWLQNNLHRNDDYLFVAQDALGEPRGTIGLSEIDFISKIAVAGRWVMQPQFRYGIEAVCLNMEFAFETLLLDTLFIDVPKNNTRVMVADKFLGYVAQRDIFLSVRGKQVPSVRLAQTSTEWRMTKEKLKYLGVLPDPFPSGM